MGKAFPESQGQAEAGYLVSRIGKRFLRKCGPKLESGCIPWTGAVGGGIGPRHTKYGQIHVNGKTVYAHRVAYELQYGPITDDQHVRHKCDNRICVNWEHLELGTREDNMQDMVKRGRGPVSQFNETDVERMRDMWANGLLQREIALNFGCSRPLVSLLISGKVQPQELHRQRSFA